MVKDPSGWGRLADYVRGVIGHFRSDERVLLWDLYNEPGNNKRGGAVPRLTEGSIQMGT